MTRRAMLALLVLLLLALPACSSSASNEIRCGRGSAGILAAQAVPSATFVPCIKTFPAGWSYGGFFAESGNVRFWLDSDRAGYHAVEVDLTRTCDTRGAVEVEDPASGTTGVRRLERPTSLEPRLTGSTFFTFAGGCVIMRYDFASGASSTLLLEAYQAIELFPRKQIVALLGENDLPLCGADAPPCVGERSP